MGGISDIEKSFSISETMVDEFIQDKRDEGELLYAAKYGTWPLPKAESDRYWIIKWPWTLIDDVEKQKLFSQEELRELLPKSEEYYKRRHQGKLPKNYTRPILD